MSQPVTDLLFDFGQVLVAWDPFRAFEGRFDVTQVTSFLRRTRFFEDFNQQLDAGLPFAEARCQFAARWPEDLAYFDAYLVGFERTVIGPVPGMAEVISGLSRTNLKMWGLTNWPAETVHVPVERVSLIKQLDGYVVSGQVGLIKPGREIFELTARRFKLTPASTLFIDDMANNLVGAADCGFQTHQFVDARTLRDDLAQRGLLNI
ncbi:MAG: HAD family phosphatase [Bifidobacteriaceae bacterium]|nr:HAD family phosphatase [Bifidobacteriaceae bacterium]